VELRNAESKEKCGIEKCGNGCGMVGKMRNVERVKWRVNLQIKFNIDLLNLNMTTTSAFTSQLRAVFVGSFE